MILAYLCPNFLPSDFLTLSNFLNFYSFILIHSILLEFINSVHKHEKQEKSCQLGCITVPLFRSTWVLYLAVSVQLKARWCNPLLVDRSTAARNDSLAILRQSSLHWWMLSGILGFSVSEGTDVLGSTIGIAIWSQ